MVSVVMQWNNRREVERTHDVQVMMTTPEKTMRLGMGRVHGKMYEKSTGQDANETKH